MDKFNLQLWYTTNRQLHLAADAPRKSARISGPVGPVCVVLCQSQQQQRFGSIMARSSGRLLRWSSSTNRHQQGLDEVGKSGLIQVLVAATIFTRAHKHTSTQTYTDIRRARWSICFGLNGNFIKKWEPPAREIRNFQSVRCLASGFWGFFFWLLLVSVGLGFCTGSSGFQKLGGRCCVSCGRWAGGGGRGTVLEMSWHEA